MSSLRIPANGTLKIQSYYGRKGKEAENDVLNLADVYAHIMTKTHHVFCLHSGGWKYNLHFSGMNKNGVFTTPIKTTASILVTKYSVYSLPWT